MLAIMADIVFLVDESGSDNGEVKQWLADVVAGNASADEGSLAKKLRMAGVDDIQYGLVGFGETPSIGNTNHSNSHFMIEGDTSSLLIDPSDPDNNPGTNDELSESELASVFTNLAVSTADDSSEDGWDAIEHTIAEYDFRPNAVPVLVLVQADEGRVPLNRTLTHDGILAAIDSKNAILNVMVVGEATEFENSQPTKWNPLFDLAPYEITTGDFANQRVLGVEADMADDILDRQHGYHLVDLVTGAEVTNPPKTKSDTLQVSFNGSNTGATGMVGTGKSILIGENITGGIGGTLGTDMQYRARSVAFDTSDDLRGDVFANPFDIGSGTTFVSEILGVNENLDGFSFDFFGTQTKFRIHGDGVITMNGTDVGTSIAELNGSNVESIKGVRTP